MNTFPLQQRGVPVSRLILGCMGFGGADWFDRSPITKQQIKEGHEAVQAALSIGITMFDHADIYKQGKAEQVFGEILKQNPGLREDIFIQSKCGIRLGEKPGMPGRYDFSSSHITNSVDGILERLGVEYIDFLLLHRPDPLMDPEDVAKALRQLKESGKVRFFGVSNMHQGQIELLQTYCDDPFVINQLEMSLAKIGWLDQGVHVNQDVAKEDMFPQGTLEYCRLKNIQIQSFGPLAQGLFSGRSLDNQSEFVKATAQLVLSLAEQKETTCESIVLSWLMTHPARIQPVIGTTNRERIQACRDAERVTLTREEWYSLYIASRGRHLP